MSHDWWRLMQEYPSMMQKIEGKFIHFHCDNYLTKILLRYIPVKYVLCNYKSIWFKCGYSASIIFKIKMLSWTNAAFHVHPWKYIEATCNTPTTKCNNQACKNVLLDQNISSHVPTTHSSQWEGMSCNFENKS